MSPTKDWDAELKKIDRQINSLPDEALLPQQTAPTPAPGAKAAPAPPAPRSTTTLGVVARLALAVIAAGSMVVWPYSTLCGVGLFGYLAASLVVSLGGLWAAIWSWKHRAASMHVISLLVILWGGGLAAREILPRVGYATPNEAHPATWFCK